MSSSALTLAEEWELKRKTCADEAVKHLKEVRSVVPMNSVCSVDFQEEDVRSEVEGIVDCGEKCEMIFEEEEEYDECVKDCGENVNIYTTGSLVLDPKTSEVLDAKIPVSCSLFYRRDKYGEMEWSEKAIGKLSEKMRGIGCEPIGEAWMHPHEFVSGFGEVEEEPAICYVNVKRMKEGGCKIGDLKKVVM